MIVGSLGAVKEVKIKNFIAYTSINQVGFILLGLCCCTELGQIYAIYYLLIYIFLTFGFLAIILNIYQAISFKVPQYFKDLKYFCKENPLIALLLSTFLLSFAGLPPFAGFFGKLYMYYALVKAKMLILFFFTLFLNLLNLYYYIKVIKYM
jgi:NADH:ubiquinone oxidoreductase subunit 2 (subunit N)